jgi:flagellar hook-associated protein 3 FlgL
MIRSTNNQTAAHVLFDIQSAAAKLQATQEQLSSGKAINRVEDDPVAAGRAMFLQNQLDDIQQYQKNVGEAQGWVDATDSAIGAVSDVMKRVKELVVQAANGTLDQTGLNAISSEVTQLIGSARENMNASYAGRYIFAGTSTNTVPYPPPGLTYAGDDNVIKRVVGQGQTVDVNQRGWDAFSNPPSSAGQNVLQLLDQINQHLQAGNQAALGNGDMTAIDSMLDQLSSARAEAGASANRLTTVESRLKDTELNVQSLLSKTQDADMAKTMVDFSQQQAVYQAALQAGAKIIKPTLLDFLG